MEHLSRLQKRWGNWVDKTFGPQSTGSPGYIKHLKEEIDEMGESPNDVFEYADCIGMIFEFARYNGITVTQIMVAYEQKLEVNRKRKWLPPDKDGAIYHDKGTNHA